MLVIVNTLLCQWSHRVSAYDDSKEYDLPKSFEAFAWWERAHPARSVRT